MCAQALTQPPVPDPTRMPVASPTKKPVAEVVPQMEDIRLKLSLIGLPADLDDLRDFKVMMEERLKALVADVAKDVDMKVTDFQEVYDLTILAGRELQTEASKMTQTIHLYYDVEVVKNPDQRYAPILIDRVRRMHDEALEKFQEYKDAKGYYYMSNFDLCTSSSISRDASFDICTLDHQIVKVKFSATNLDPSLNREELDEELLKIYSLILNSISGLELIDISVDSVAETSYGTDVHFNVDVVKTNGIDKKDLIETELAKEASKKDIVDKVQEYTTKSFEGSGKEVEDVNWCFDSQGIFNMQCNLAVADNLALPIWAIIAIASTAGLILLCVSIACCAFMRQRSEEKEDEKYNMEAYITRPEQRRGSQIEVMQKRRAPPLAPVRRSRRHSSGRRDRDKRMRPRKEKKYTRTFRRSKRRRDRSRSPPRPQRRRSSARKYEHRDTRETQPDEEMQMLALPPPQYDYPPLALPPPEYDSPPPQTEFLALPPPQYDDYSGAAIYCDDEEVNRPDPPMQAGPDASEQQRQQQQQSQDVLMLTDGRASSDGSGGNGPYLAIEPAGHNWNSMYSDDDEPKQSEPTGHNWDSAHFSDESSDYERKN